MIRKPAVGDSYILHSEDGHDYKIVIVNVNECREPSMMYAVDLYDDKGNSLSNDVLFCGEEFFGKCDK